MWRRISRLSSRAIKDAQKRLKVLLGGDRKRGSIKCEAKLGHDTTALEEELARLQSQVSPVEAQIAGWEAELLPYKDVLDRLKEARKGLRALKTELVTRLQTASDALSDGEAQRLVLDLLRDELLGQLERYVTEHRQRVIAAVETWWDKYRVTLGEIEAKDAEVNRRLDEMLRGLGYVDGI
jgi:chromosome segregation ATPase